MEVREKLPMPVGRVKLYRVYDTPTPRGGMGKTVAMLERRLALSRGMPETWWPVNGRWLPNLVLQEWGGIVGNLLTQGLANYRISGMLIEFQNVADIDTPVVPPTFDRGPDSGVAYYESLANSADTDYLRIPLIAATLDTTDPVNYPFGNLVTFFAQTQGVVGVNGLPFSDADNSVVYGAALVAMVSESDATQDLVFSRYYLPTDQQQPKLATSQVGIQWELTLL